jgi:hypothetical protein
MRLKKYQFQIRRRHGGSYETIFVFAEGSVSAISKLPQCVTWDFVGKR